jgi:hexosaminidase
MQIVSCNITDFPRFKHRGLMVDTARHFLPLPVLMTIIDGMEASKLNIFHWHIVDEQAFPYQSKAFPELRYYVCCLNIYIFLW